MIKYKELKEKSKELERKYKLNHYELLQRFMFERILERISVSKYQENFILKVVCYCLHYLELTIELQEIWIQQLRD